MADAPDPTSYEWLLNRTKTLQRRLDRVEIVIDDPAQCYYDEKRHQHLVKRDALLAALEESDG